MKKEEVKERLTKYAGLKLKVKGLRSRMAELLYEAAHPAMKQSDGSKCQPGRGDRFENAAIRYMEKKAKFQAQIDACEDEIMWIEDAIDSLDDPWESEVLFRRYLFSDQYRLTPWKIVALEILGDDDEKDIKTITRLHGRAVRSLAAVLGDKADIR